MDMHEIAIVLAVIIFFVIGVLLRFLLLNAEPTLKVFSDRRLRALELSTLDPDESILCHILRVNQLLSDLDRLEASGICRLYLVWGLPRRCLRRRSFRHLSSTLFMVHNFLNIRLLKSCIFYCVSLSMLQYVLVPLTYIIECGLHLIAELDS